MKIVSLLPSATEIVYALGLGDDLVGVTDECDFPPDAVTKPVVSRSALPQGRPLTSRGDRRGRPGADGRARAALRPGQGAPPPRAARRDPDPGPLPGLRGAERAGAAGAWTSSGSPDAKVVSLDPHTLEDVIGADRGRREAMLGRAPSARSEIADLLRSRVARVKEIAMRLPTIQGLLRWIGRTRRSSPGTGCPRWWRRSAASNLLNAKGEPSKVVTWRADPRREPRGHRVHAVRLLPGGSRGGGRRTLRPSGLRRHAGRPQRQRRSRSTPRRSSRARARASSTAWRSWPGRCTPRPIRNRRPRTITRLK